MGAIRKEKRHPKLTDKKVRHEQPLKSSIRWALLHGTRTVDDSSLCLICRTLLVDLLISSREQNRLSPAAKEGSTLLLSNTPTSIISPMRCTSSLVVFEVVPAWLPRGREHRCCSRPTASTALTRRERGAGTDERREGGGGVRDWGMEGKRTRRAQRRTKTTHFCLCACERYRINHALLPLCRSVEG